MAIHTHCRHDSHILKKFGTVIFAFLFISVFLSIPLYAEFRGIQVFSRTMDGSTKAISLYSGYYALVVGVSEYNNGWPHLPNPVNDAREVAALLRELGWDVDLLENPDGKTLRNRLNKLIADQGRDKEKAILFWYSGHGHTLQEADGTKLGYFIPVDAPDPAKDLVGFMDRAVSMRMMKTVSKQILSKHVLMLFDSCFSGAVFQLARAKPSPYIEEKVSLPVREFITAGTENEQVPDRSVFKEVFIQGIQDDFADLNHDGYVTGEELGAYLQERVINYSRKAQHPQFGKINNPKLDKGDFVFVKKKTNALKTANMKMENTESENRLLGNQVKTLKPKLLRNPKMGLLFVKPEPKNAKIRVLNIRPRFYQGMELEPGIYHLEVSSDGYKMVKRWVEVIAGKERTVKIALEPLQARRPDVTAISSHQSVASKKSFAAAPRPALGILPWKLLGSADGWNFLALDALAKIINETETFAKVFSYYDLKNVKNLKKIPKGIIDYGVAKNLWEINSSKPNYDLLFRLGRQLEVDAILTSYIDVKPADPDNGRITVFLFDVKTKKTYSAARYTDFYEQNGYKAYYSAGKYIFSSYRMDSKY